MSCRIQEKKKHHIRTVYGQQSGKQVFYGAPVIGNQAMLGTCIFTQRALPRPGHSDLSAVAYYVIASWERNVKKLNVLKEA